MKKFLFVAFLLHFIPSAFAGISVCYDDGRVTSFSLRGSSFAGCAYYDAGFNVTQNEYGEIKSLLINVDIKYLKEVDGKPVEMTAQEKTAVDDAIAAAAETAFRNTQKSLIDGTDGVYLRALINTLIDEINILRQWNTSFKAEVAAASSLADLKTRVSTLPNTPDRTLAQAKTAILSKIDDGSAD